MKLSPSKRRTLAVSIIGVLLAIAIFLPELVGFGWHVMNGKEASYHRWRIPVPTGWFATRQGESLTLERMLHFPLWNQTPTVVFLPMHTTKNFPFDLTVWTNVQVNIQKRRGYRLASTRQIRMGGAPGYCWEFMNSRDNSHWWITCLVPSERLSADFSGQHAFAAAFYAILPQITRVAGPI